MNTYRIVVDEDLVIMDNVRCKPEKILGGSVEKKDLALVASLKVGEKVVIEGNIEIERKA